MTSGERLGLECNVEWMLPWRIKPCSGCVLVVKFFFIAESITNFLGMVWCTPPRFSTLHVENDLAAQPFVETTIRSLDLLLSVVVASHSDDAFDEPPLADPEQLAVVQEHSQSRREEGARRASAEREAGVLVVQLGPCQGELRGVVDTCFREGAVGLEAGHWIWRSMATSLTDGADHPEGTYEVVCQSQGGVAPNDLPY